MQHVLGNFLPLRQALDESYFCETVQINGLVGIFAGKRIGDVNGRQSRVKRIRFEPIVTRYNFSDSIWKASQPKQVSAGLGVSSPKDFALLVFDRNRYRNRVRTLTPICVFVSQMEV